MKLQTGLVGEQPVLRSGVLPPHGIHHSSETRHTKIQLWCSKAGVIGFPPPQTTDGNTLGQLCRCRCRCPRSRALAALHTLHPLCAEVLALVCRPIMKKTGVFAQTYVGIGVRWSQKKEENVTSSKK